MLIKHSALPRALLISRPHASCFISCNALTAKKGRPRTKTGLAEKDMKLNGRSMPPGFDRLESFGHDELTAKRCYFRCSRPPDVDGIKIFDKDDQATKH